MKPLAQRAEAACPVCVAEQLVSGSESALDWGVVRIQGSQDPLLMLYSQERIQGKALLLTSDSQPQDLQNSVATGHRDAAAPVPAHIPCKNLL